MQSVKGFVTPIVLLIGFLPAYSARACDCMPFSVEQSWEGATAVFVGEICSERINILSPWTRTIEFRVLQSWKGATDEGLVAVVVPISGSNCGPDDTKPGERFLVFATVDESQTLSAICGAQRLCAPENGIEDAEELESLGIEPLLEDGFDLAQLRLFCDTGESSQAVDCAPPLFGLCGVGMFGPSLLLTTVLLVRFRRSA